MYPRVTKHDVSDLTRTLNACLGLRLRHAPPLLGADSSSRLWDYESVTGWAYPLSNRPYWKYAGRERYIHVGRPPSRKSSKLSC